MDVNEIKTYLEENKDNEEVVGLIKSYEKNLTLETVMDFLANDKAGKSYLDSCCDRYSSKAIETARANAIEKFKADELPKLLEDEIKKATNKDLTPEQIQLKELQDQIAQMQKEKQQAELSNKYKDILSQKGLDTRLVKFILSDNEDDINSNIDIFTEIIKTNADAKVKERIGETTYTPPKGEGVRTMSRAELLSKGYNFIQKFAIENPDEYKRIIG